MCIRDSTESAQELADYYSMADVFVNATLEDNFPTTNLEALSCGTPVITYETGGSPESLDEKCGRVVPKGDEAALEHAIREEAACPGTTEDVYKRQLENSILRSSSWSWQKMQMASSSVLTLRCV